MPSSPPLLPLSSSPAEHPPPFTPRRKGRKGVEREGECSHPAPHPSDGPGGKFVSHRGRDVSSAPRSSAPRLLRRPRLPLLPSSASLENQTPKRQKVAGKVELPPSPPSRKKPDREGRRSVKGKGKGDGSGKVKRSMTGKMNRKTLLRASSKRNLKMKSESYSAPPCKKNALLVSHFLVEGDEMNPFFGFYEDFYMERMLDELFTTPPSSSSSSSPPPSFASLPTDVVWHMTSGAWVDAETLGKMDLLFPERGEGGGDRGRDLSWKRLGEERFRGIKMRGHLFGVSPPVCSDNTELSVRSFKLQFGDWQRQVLMFENGHRECGQTSSNDKVINIGWTVSTSHLVHALPSSHTCLPRPSSPLQGVLVSSSPSAIEGSIFDNHSPALQEFRALNLRTPTLYVEVEILRNPDNVSLALADFQDGGVSSLTFSPNTGAVIKERKSASHPVTVVEGAYIQPLPQVSSNQFLGSVGFFVSQGRVAFLRKVQGKAWECSGFVSDLFWSRGEPRELSPCLAFRDSGNYRIRMKEVGGTPPIPVPPSYLAEIPFRGGEEREGREGWRPMNWVVGPADEEEEEEDE